MVVVYFRMMSVSRLHGMIIEWKVVKDVDESSPGLMEALS
jgi:hypothetical protein